MNTDIDYFVLRKAICAHLKSISEVEVRLIIWRYKDEGVRKIVHECLKHFAKSLCGKGKEAAEKDSLWYADYHINASLAAITDEFERLNNLTERVW